MSHLQNKIALVTGAGSGIGRAVAFAYSQAGATVLVSDIDDAAGEETVSLIQRTDREAVFIRADAARAEDHNKLVRVALEHFGGLHIACNNAGIGGPSISTGEYSIDDWQKVINVNLNGVFYGCRYQIPAMLESGGGAIVNMASILGQVGFANSPAYVAAKHGVVGLTRTIALEYAAKGIRANSVGPAFINTPLLEHMDKETIRYLESKHAIGRLGTAEEVAELVLWLSSEKASFANGGYYPIDGGYLAQ
ncbi:SDR family NAD(P)-dependent oxidoreductase [Cellvibrio polysaccharolyticus]|uniref:SDR family NAD(P)-dependent oxidoreductase n=1 Tax=Cellvibrio polysaccharolyticus TaxID=2082724 RepID=A0A928V2N6_9GAMM|nr:SDR family oxidoreductase [Cellvibrio polysaccharolyticus]MBE8716688.1 SDR family NAD(P)-dependent oxidoreductase [Cellvibrio polysaccharolyticus]